ncbi:MAG: TetR/AcrR family transcriptional regulator [Bacteroidia bacterium]
MSPKQAQVLETGRNLFWKHGTKRVSVEEICREAGVSKMTFYRYYPNKNELIKAVIILIIDESMVDYRELMARDISFKAKMEEIVRLKFEGSNTVSEEFAKDIYFVADPEIKAVYETAAANIMQEVMADYIHAQEQGWIRSDIKPGFISYMMEAMRNQYFDEKLRSMYPNIRDLAVELNHFLFYGLGLKE